MTARPDFRELGVSILDTVAPTLATARTLLADPSSNAREVIGAVDEAIKGLRLVAVCCECSDWGVET